MAITLHSSFAGHPGEWLRLEIVEPAGLNVTALADHLDVSRQSISKLLNGRQGLSADMARVIDKVSRYYEGLRLDEVAFARRASVVLTQVPSYSIRRVRAQTGFDRD